MDPLHIFQAIFINIIYLRIFWWTICNSAFTQCLAQSRVCWAKEGHAGTLTVQVEWILLGLPGRLISASGLSPFHFTQDTDVSSWNIATFLDLPSPLFFLFSESDLLPIRRFGKWYPCSQIPLTGCWCFYIASYPFKFISTFKILPPNPIPDSCNF